MTNKKMTNKQLFGLLDQANAAVSTHSELTSGYKPCTFEFNSDGWCVTSSIRHRDIRVKPINVFGSYADTPEIAVRRFIAGLDSWAEMLRPISHTKKN